MARAWTLRSKDHRTKDWPLPVCRFSLRTPGPWEALGVWLVRGTMGSLQLQVLLGGQTSCPWRRRILCPEEYVFKKTEPPLLLAGSFLQASARAWCAQGHGRPRGQMPARPAGAPYLGGNEMSSSYSLSLKTDSSLSNSRSWREKREKTKSLVRLSGACKVTGRGGWSGWGL